MKKRILFCWVLCFSLLLFGCTGEQPIDDWLKAPILEASGPDVIYNGNKYIRWDYNNNDYRVPVLTNELENLEKRFIGRAELVGSYYLVFEEEFGDAILFYTQYQQWFLKEGYEFPDLFSLDIVNLSVVNGMHNIWTLEEVANEEPYSLYNFVDVENSFSFGSGKTFTDTGYSIAIDVSGYKHLKVQSKFIIENSGELYFSVYGHEKNYKIKDEYQDDIFKAINTYEKNNTNNKTGM